ncbi:MAG: flagellar hook protein FlgE [Beijerinckiaceae bacterium]|jgi:flagellar hook protein FlgE|nr:flagellar hook protein FlgE [Beijerinckiaceae bacterium]
MSFFGTMRTAASGMNAQASRLSVVSDNIANVNTTGYKQASTEFETVLGQQATHDYMSGGVTAHVRQSASAQGALRGTTSVTDLAINGDGFFVVMDPEGTSFLTRAGSFLPDEDGFLVNTAGYKLLGFPLGDSVASGPAGIGGTTAVTIGQLSLTAKPSTTGSFTANMPSMAAITPAADLPSSNSATSQTVGKSSIVAYDNLGAPIMLDMYFNKTADNTWEVSVFDKATAAANGGFPYSSGPLTTQTLDFDPANGKMLAGSPLSIAVPGGATLDLDLTKSTQLAANYSVIDTAVNGNAPSAVDRVEIDAGGTLYSIYANGTRTPTYKIALANVRSPDNLEQLNGNVYVESANSGGIVVGSAQSGGLGKIVSSSLEDSTVDLAQELASMIESQRGYTANSKVFQTSADLIDVLVNLRS